MQSIEVGISLALPWVSFSKLDRGRLPGDGSFRLIDSLSRLHQGPQSFADEKPRNIGFEKPPDDDCKSKTPLIVSHMTCLFFDDQNPFGLL